MAKIVKIVLMMVTLLALHANPLLAGEDTKVNASRESIVDLLETMGSYKLGMQMMEQVMNAFKNGINSRLPNDRKIPDELWASIVAEIKTEFNKDDLYNIVIPIYQKYFSDSEIKAITAFYKSDTGKKFVNAMPSIAIESSQAGEEWAKKSMERILPRIQRRLREMGYPKESAG